MPEMTPVADHVIAPNPQQGLTTLSNILGVRQQMQGLQTGQYIQQRERAAATIEQQSARENQAGAALLADPVGNGLIDENGQPTKDFQKIIFKAMPTTGAQHADAILKAAKSKIDFNSAVNTLRTNERAEVADTIGGAAARAGSVDDVISQVDGLLASKEGTPEYEHYKTIADTAKQILTHTANKGKIQIPPPPGAEPWRKAALGLQSTILGAAGTVGAGGVATPSAGTVDTGAQILPGTFAPPLQGGGFSHSDTAINRQLGPTDQPGYKRAVAAASTEGGAGAQNDETLYNNVVQEGSKATQVKSLSEDIQRLAGEVQTGEYSKAFANKWAAAAQSLGISPDNLTAATKRQILAKMASQLKLQSEAGATTDAERAGIESAMPNPDEMTPQAVQQAARYVGAQAQVKSAAMDLANRHRQVSGGRSTGLREVLSPFMQNADPRIFEYNSLPAGKERQNYLRAHFGDAASIHAFLQKQEALKAYGAVQ